MEEGHSGGCNDGNMSDQEYEVECITAEKMSRKKRVYRVKWRGPPEEDSTWENESSLADAKECLEEWKQSGRQQTKRLKKTAMAAPEEPKPAAMEAKVTEAKAIEVVLTEAEAEETEADEADETEADETEADETEADARAAVEPQVISSTTSAVETLSDLQANADVWLSVLEEVALLREGVPPKRSYDEPNFIAHTLPFQALQLVSQVCKAWRI